MDLMMMERVGDRWEKMEGSCSTGQSPQWAVVPVEEEDRHKAAVFKHNAINTSVLINEEEAQAVRLLEIR
jgi:hypothetical protein